MYLEIDLFTPKKNLFLRNTKIKNIVLNHWPRKTVDGIEVFDKMYFYWKPIIIDTPDTRAIYKLFGTSVLELYQNNYNGVSQAWFHLKPFKLDKTTVNNTQVINYINENSELNKEYKVVMIYTQKFTGLHLARLPIVTDSQILSMVEGGYDSRFVETVIENNVTNENSAPQSYGSFSSEDASIESRTKQIKKIKKPPLISYNEKINPCTFASIIDKDDLLFSSESKVVSKTITPVWERKNRIYRRRRVVLGAQDEITEYTITAKIEYKYKRIVDASDPSASTVINSIVDVANNQNFGHYSFGSQVRDMKHVNNPVLDDELLATDSSDPGFQTDSSSSEQFIRVDSASKLAPSKFVKMFSMSLDTGYAEEECSGWKCYIAPILMIIIIVVSIMSLQPEGIVYGLAGLGTMSGLEFAAAYLGLLALELTLGALALSLVAKYFEKNGDYGTAISFGSSIGILQSLATVVGYMAMITGIAAVVQGAISKIATIAEKEATKDTAVAAGSEAATGTPEISASATALDASSPAMAVSSIAEPIGFGDYVDATVEYAKGYVLNFFSSANESLAQTMMKAVNVINKAFDAYTKWINPIDNPPGQYSEQTSGEGVPLSTETVTLQQSYFEEYQFCEMNNLMDNIPDEMSGRGLMRRTLSKYYDGTSH